MQPPSRPRRSVLYMPASNAKAVSKARSLPADAIVLDLEDAVAPDMKAEAREAAVAAVREGGFGRREVVIRCNALDTPWGADDLAAAAAAGPDGVLVPKIASADDVQAYDAALAGAPANTRLWVMIETCAVVPRLFDVAALAASTRLSTFVMGTNDLAKEMRARLLPGRAPFLPILTLTVAAARAHGLVAIDGVCNAIHDADLLAAEAAQGVEFGFDGKSAIHPAQVEICNAAFSPSAEEIAWAQSVVDAFGLPEAAGKGALRVDGKMVELLHHAQAQQILAIAAQIEGR
ncbi:citrate lyase subunit beta/citryl-CoA lyase [Novosphingobium kunmingense]|uniref:Citrate lyase subunit beta/citryl-CoA lyase n=1 Tax=Novosphingobium kunmingense TaxID=1211806 RepID=A0A2N0H7M3_9SPHN|nr:CoA ester lyase [Novosphingobium kunmingense]PKB14914.1 citrate lyase subunit beta/citryl-CoA lyase [Novosphingobium kunmingense]